MALLYIFAIADVNSFVIPQVSPFYHSLSYHTGDTLVIVLVLVYLFPLRGRAIINLHNIPLGSAAESIDTTEDQHSYNIPHTSIFTMHVVLTGATGLVGSSVLDAMIKAKDITKISILSRKPVQMADDAKDPRINVIIHRDFENYDSKVLEQLQGAKACVWALGISQTKVSAEEYVKITKDYTLAAAKSFATLSTSPTEPFRFIYVSGEGATQKPGRFSAIFARVKGETETELGDLSASMPTSLHADSVRPAFVDPKHHKAIHPYIPDPGMLYKVSSTALSPLLPLMRGMHSPTEHLGDFLTRLAMGKVDSQIEGPGAFKLGGSWVIENVGFRRIMGL